MKTKVVNKEAKIQNINSQVVAVIVLCPFCDEEIYTHSRITNAFPKRDEEWLYRTISCDDCESIFDVPPITINNP